jgi:hypothetical protein
MALAPLESTAKVRKGVETPTGEDKRGRNPGLFVVTRRHRYQSGVGESIGDLGPIDESAATSSFQATYPCLMAPLLEDHDTSRSVMEDCAEGQIRRKI